MNLLYIVPLLPRYDRGSGENRLFEIMRLLCLKGCGVTVLQAIPYTGIDEARYEALLRDIGVRYVTQVGEFFKDVKSKDYDCCVISWYGLALEYISLLRSKFPAAKIIVDSVDVHWLRYERGVISGELVMTPDELEYAKTQEKLAYAEADEVWAVTQEDKNAILKELPDCEIRVVSNIHRKDFRNHSGVKNNNGIIFVGGFNHPPNESAALWGYEICNKFRNNSRYSPLYYIVGDSPSERLRSLHDGSNSATDFIRQMQGMIGKLIENELAYQAEDGDVNFAVRLLPQYGQLSGKTLDELNAGERVAIGGGKRDPLDFVLWKSAKPEEPADTRWNSPWGEGRPGWHIECSAMSCDLLGEHFDIHGGGADLQFPHHENEIAQSEGALYGQNRQENDAPFVNYWMHNGHIRVNEEKMSKSLGNFFLIRDVLKSFDPEVLRFFMLKAHYRSPINYSDAQLEEARSGLTRLYTALTHIPEVNVAPIDQQNPWAKRFADAMNDDFNTPEAIAVLFDLASEVNRAQGADKQKLAGLLKSLGGTLNFLQRDPTNFLQAGSKDQLGLSGEQIEEQIAARVAAKQAKDFAKADGIRKALLEQGVVLEDKPGGITEWRRA